MKFDPVGIIKEDIMMVVVGLSKESSFSFDSFALMGSVIDNRNFTGT